MRTPSKEHTRAERLREHATELERARGVIGAMGVLVRGREARARDGEPPLEVGFAAIDIDGRSLPAGVWVALRRDDADAALDAMTTVSQSPFVIEEREEVGEGYRLQTVQDTLPLPESELLIAQLSRALDVPLDVLSVIGDWGPDDPRAASEIDDLLNSRFGPVDLDDERRSLFAWHAPVAAPEVSTAADPTGSLTLSVAEAAQVLRLDDAQVQALTILVSNATVTFTPR
jgi:hypothetical protein